MRLRSVLLLAVCGVLAAFALAVSVARRPAEPLAMHRRADAALTAEQATALTNALRELTARVLREAPPSPQGSALAASLDQLERAIDTGTAIQLADAGTNVEAQLDAAAKAGTLRAHGDTAALRAFLREIANLATRCAPC